MKRNFLFVGIFAFAVLAMVGCKEVDQAKEDLATGINEPLELTVDPLTNRVTVEKSPTEKAQEITDIGRMIPYVGPFMPVITPIIAGLFAWTRGRRIRKTKGTSTKPITGALGASLGVGSVNIENAVQTVTDVFHGAYEVGADGSALKRGWKTALSIILTIVGGALLMPSIRDFVVHHGDILAVITFGSAVFSGLEKKLQDVLPVVPAVKPTV